GLFVLPVRVYRAAEAFELPDTPEYQGCRSWVDQGRALPTEGEPVLDDAAFADLRHSLALLLTPTAAAGRGYGQQPVCARSFRCQPGPAGALATGTGGTLFDGTGQQTGGQQQGWQQLAGGA